MQKLTCGQLATTYQEDADFPSVWYNGLAHKHAINVPRVQQNIHDVIVYWQGGSRYHDHQAIDVIFKSENWAVWTNFIRQRPAAKETIDLKFRSVFSQRSATRLKRLSRPTPCSMRARAL